VSRLPVALDGSASGYQHLSALARDRAGAEATNLLDREEPADLYLRVVHALDAAHLMLTVRRLHGEGLRHFAAIHDSYGVHAYDADRLVRALREEFVRMYRAPLLEQFLDAQIAALPAGASTAAIEAFRATIPITGDLDLDEVLRARYMFA